MGYVEVDPPRESLLSSKFSFKSIHNLIRYFLHAQTVLTIDRKVGYFVQNLLSIEKYKMFYAFLPKFSNLAFSDLRGIKWIIGFSYENISDRNKI